MGRVVARSNADLQRVIDLVLNDPAIVRSSTVIALATQVPYRVLPLALSRSSSRRASTNQTAVHGSSYGLLRRCGVIESKWMESPGPSE